MANTIEIKDNRVVKTFESRMNYVREISVYEKIKGLGLAPELTGNWDGAIEHEYIGGDNFEDVLHGSVNDPYAFIKNIKLFLDWYKVFRNKVNMSLGDMDFSDFIISDGKLYCIDFEHCKPATVEHDIAILAASIALIDKSYTRLGLENAKIFVKNAFEELSISSVHLYDDVKKAMAFRCEENNIPNMKAADEYLASFVCCSFVRKPEYGNEIEAVADALARSKHMWTLFADENMDLENEKQIRYLMSCNKMDCDAVYLTQSGKMQSYPLLVKTEGAAVVFDRLRDSQASIDRIIRSKFHAKPLALEYNK